MTTVSGKVEPRFGQVAEAFRRNCESGMESGAAICVYQHGRPVVDLWAGLADLETGKPWEHDSIAVFYSTTKGLTASAVTLLVERGVLDLDAPVSEYWPAFAAEGKGAIPLRWLCSHQAGLSAPARPITIEDVANGTATELLAAQRPLWEPGKAHGYHAWTGGWLLSEVIRGATGHTVGEFFAKEIAAPLGLDLYIGLPASEEGRVARLVMQQQSMKQDLSETQIEEPVPGMEEFYRAFADPSSLTHRSLVTAFAMKDLDSMNTPPFHQVEIPSGGGIGSATSLARLYAALIGEVDGVRLIRPETMQVAQEVEASGKDTVLLGPATWGATHFSLAGGRMWPDFVGHGVFGHPGGGGSVGFADPENGIAFGYVPNKMLLGQDAQIRSGALVDATYRSLDL